MPGKEQKAQEAREIDEYMSSPEIRVPLAAIF